MKITSHDILRILRLYEVANDDSTPKDIGRLSVKNPKTSNTLASFVFDGLNYAILFDETLADDSEAVAREINIVHPGRTVTPRDNTLSASRTHAMPYQGKQCYLVALNAHTVRLDLFLAQTRPEFSRSSWQQFIRRGYVEVNDQIVTSSKFPVASDSQIVVTLPAPDTHENRELPVVFESDDIIVIDKPAGVLTHAKSERDNEFTVEVFLKRFVDNTLGSEERHGVVHRLDRDTSGLMVCARHKLSYDHLKQQFADREVEKTYHAVVIGDPKQEKAVVDVPIARSNSAPGTFVASVNGKSAETYFEVVERGEANALLKLMPKTGRTHQLRVHLSYMNLPILGDRLYSSSKTVEDRMYLHASELKFVGLDSKKNSFKSPIPSSFHNKISNWS